ncbi:MAG: GC-type dockerin domain-anchored protein [Phycisphaerales bacterium JB039]
MRLSPQPLSLLVPLAAATAMAQPALHIEVDRPLLRLGESTAVRVLASFPPEYRAMAILEFDLLVSPAPGEWSDLATVWPMVAGGSTPGTRTGAGIEGVLAWQLSPLCDPCIGQLDNPIVCWTATYTAPGISRDGFTIDLATLTRRFEVYVAPLSSERKSLLADVVEGAGVIRIQPCNPDCDESGTLDIFDFLCFQNAFAAGDPYADCDKSGALDFLDFLCFQNWFTAGCP